MWDVLLDEGEVMNELLDDVDRIENERRMVDDVLDDDESRTWAAVRLESMINLLLLMFFYYSACAFFSDVMEKEEGSVVRIFEQPSNNKKKWLCAGARG